jgi:hypothetical protein
MNRRFVEIDESKHEIRFDTDLSTNEEAEGEGEGEKGEMDEKKAAGENKEQAGQVYVMPA